jgi:hypothetical protein
MTVLKKAPMLRAAVLSLLAIGSMSQAAPNIFWHNSGGDILLQSDGMGLDSSFQLELGYFSGSFTPTAGNTTEWSTYWKPWDLVSTQGGFNPGAGFYASSKGFTGSSTATVISEYGQSFSIPTGSQAYLWVYNSKDHLEGTEWALVTNTTSDGTSAPAWLFPNPALDASPADPDWQLLDVGTVVLGGVENVQGPGSFSSSPGSFALQTSAIPEPGAALLIFTLGILAQIRRHRRMI